MHAGARHNTLSLGGIVKGGIPSALLVIVLMSSACISRLPPTPGPFPVEGVRQITSEYAFYQNLMWSPSGRLIAATRCPILQFTPSCLGNEETVLIDVSNGDSVTVSFQSLTPNRVSSYPVAWADSGDRLLLYLEESPTEAPAPPSQTTYRYLAYDPSTGGFMEIPVEGIPIDWDESSEQILLIRANNEGVYELALYSYVSGDLAFELTLGEAGDLAGPHALSPDGATLLRGDSPTDTRCNEISAYSIGSHSDFVPMLTMACYPAWSQNGAKIAFARKDHPQGEPNQIMIAGSDGSDPQSLFGDQLIALLASPTWSPDGSMIAFTRGGLENANAVYIVPVPESMRP